MNAKTFLWVGLFGLAVGCNNGPKDSEDTDVDAVDTDVVDTDVALTGCEAADACDGCVTEGESFTCDCSDVVAADPGTCRPIRVAVLDDGVDADPSSGSYVVPMLAEAKWDASHPMFTVIDLGRRWVWDGSLVVGDDNADTGAGDTDAGDTDTSELLSIDNTDVVFLLEGADYSSELRPAGAAALASFVAAGGGLVRTEWGSAYELLEPEVCPMQEYQEYIEDTDVKSWTAVSSTSAAAAIVQDGLPATFGLASSIVLADVKTAEMTGDVVPETLFTVSFDNGETTPVQAPALVYWPATTTSATPHGAIAWINHDFVYMIDLPDFEPMQEPEFAKLITNTARAVAP